VLTFGTPRDDAGIRIPVAVVEPGAVPRSEGKAVRGWTAGRRPELRLRRTG
jgi:hypothetical protein